MKILRTAALVAAFLLPAAGHAQLTPGGGTFTWPGTAGNATGGTTTAGTMPYVNAYIAGGSGASVTANPPVNQTVTSCAGNITAGGTAQVAIAAQTTLHQFTITNNDATHGGGEPLWISLTTTAVGSGGTGSDPLAPPTSSTTLAGMGSITLVNGTNHAISIFALTTGHTFGCFWS